MEIHFLAVSFPVCEFQGCGVDAIPLSCRFWPVVKNMPQVTAAAGAYNLGPDHPMAPVLQILNTFILQGFCETGPPGS